MLTTAGTSRLVTSGRLAIFAVAALTIVIGSFVVAAIFQEAWSPDIERYIQASRDLIGGRFGVDRAYLYSPFAALLTLPLTVLPLAIAALAWLVAKLAVLAWGIRHETRGLQGVDVALIVLAVVSFVPTSYDLLLGNVTILVVAAVALVAWRRDAFASGVALGLVLAAAPKPQLIPVLVWMLVYRRRALVGASTTALLATAFSAALVGVGPYLAWLDVLRAPAYLGGSMAGNLTPQALLPGLAVAFDVAAVIGFAIALRRGETNGLAAALATGLIVAPYTLAYAAIGLLLVLRPLAIARPRVAFGLAAFGSVGVLLMLPVYVMSWLAASVLVALPPLAREPHPRLLSQALHPEGARAG